MRAAKSKKLIAENVVISWFSAKWTLRIFKERCYIKWAKFIKIKRLIYNIVKWKRRLDIIAFKGEVNFERKKLKVLRNKWKNASIIGGKRKQ